MSGSPAGYGSGSAPDSVSPYAYGMHPFHTSNTPERAVLGILTRYREIPRFSALSCKFPYYTSVLYLIIDTKLLYLLDKRLQKPYRRSKLIVVFNKLHGPYAFPALRSPVRVSVY